MTDEPADDRDESDEEPRRSSLAELADRLADRTGGSDADDRASESGAEADPDTQEGGFGLNLSPSNRREEPARSEPDAGETEGSDELFSWDEFEPAISSASDDEAAAEVLASAPNVLLVDGASGDRSPCFECLARAPSRDLGVVVVSFEDDASDWLADWRSHHGQLPPEVAFVRVGGYDRGRRTETVSTEAGPTRVERTAVTSPTDLTRLGITVSRRLGDADERGLTPVLCLRSVTDLLEYVETERLFRFLHTLTGRVRTADGSAHYHVDPDAASEETLRTLKQLFDDTLVVTDRGGLRPAKDL